ncbi:osmotically-inducible protein OsmY [Paraburkholderia sp. GAS41]|jgi:osmotically-inducible protein OsmY|uniref:BON domain-containing protein n=1 Tax=Paraburkholderia sp. GAS41 TaxID=3035134 RepID=UPI003D1B9558
MHAIDVMTPAVVVAAPGERSNRRWAQPSQNVIVKQGIVHLWAVVQSEEERRAICVAAESVHGAKAVRSYIEFPMALPAM